MKAGEVLQRQYGLMYRMVALNVDGVTAGESVVQPRPGGNCANWILAHLTTVQNGVMSLLREAPVSDREALKAGRLLPPVTGPENAFDWEELRSQFMGSQERCLAALARLTEEDLDEAGFTDPFGQAVTRGEFLAFLATHQIYHAGQLGMFRRLAGLDGAIKVPAERAIEA